MRKLLFLLSLPVSLVAQLSPKDISRCDSFARNVTIIRDHFGVPHIYGKSDADAVFGIMYAQCEDDFPRVETNYIDKLGRLAEVNGETDIYRDLWIRLVIDSADAIKDYRQSPPWFHALLDAFADGINYYLYKHPDKKPALLTHFEPWYALLWSDGSIGAISTADFGPADLQDCYAAPASTSFVNPASVARVFNESDKDSIGSNGFAFAPSVTESGHAILYLNPHVTFYFRPEMQVTSEEGLCAYGAVTWGQFFIYQGFNAHCGWMNTSNAVDVSDAYIENISLQKGKWMYEYEHKQQPVIEKKITIRYKTSEGMGSKTIDTWWTGHGPVMAKQNGHWISVRSNNRSMNALMQSYRRTKSTGLANFQEIMNMRGNTSNNTVYADADGHIGYWHGNFIPIRDTKYDWSRPVDGTIAATEWKGVHELNSIVHLIDPKNGWLQNCNSTPFTVAGEYSPKKEDYPVYMAPDKENFRGVNAVRVLSAEKKYTIDKVIAAGYNRHLAFFDQPVAAVLKAYDALRPDDSLKMMLKEPIDTLRAWNKESGEHSVATTLATAWGAELLSVIPGGSDYVIPVAGTEAFCVDAANGPVLLSKLQQAMQKLKTVYGDWRIPIGSINRFQRLASGGYDDDQPSLPIGFVSSKWGQLPSYSSQPYPGTKKRYGTTGNSFICAVEFGPRIKAKSLLAGGESGDPASPHFFDQAEMYRKGIFKDVLFYKEDVLKQAEKTYHPGE